ncbi:multidrug effflux MFS transporter [Streptomyces sp. NPDC003717]|uniref:multidrug effflux MFS transporter n=1 Tax=Streptomyces sp. NPDC003717 TaxID=3154276 RepID=UPI00339E17AB
MSHHAEEAVAADGERSRSQPGTTARPEGAARRRTGLFVAVLLGALAAVPPLSMDMYLPALPQVAGGLDANATLVQLTLTACLTGMALGQLVVGPMSDRWGRRGPLLVGLAVYVAACVACAFAPGAEVLVACRLLQGLAGSAGVVIARAVVRDLYDGLAMARFFSTLLLISSIAPIVAPVIGAQVLRLTTWRGIFLILAAIGAALGVLVWRALPETLPARRRQSGGVRQALWIMRGLLADRVFAGYLMVNGFAYGALFSYIAASPFVVQEVYGASPQTFSLLFGLNSFGLMLTGQLNGKVLVGRVALDKVLGCGLALLAVAGAALLAVTLGGVGGAGTVPLAAGLFVMISALGLILPNTSALALMRTPHAAGSASALIGTSCFLVGAIASSAVALAGKDTAVPMALVQCASALAAVVAFVTVCRPGRRAAGAPRG